MRRLLAPGAKLAWALWDDLFPPTCPGCDIPQPRGALCGRCRNEIELVPTDLCARCEERPMGQRGLCVLCRTSRSPLGAVRAGALYEGLCLERVRRFKYPPMGRFLEPGPERFATWLVLEAAQRAGPPPDIVVPVPHHPRRLRARGFVPASLLARSLAREKGVPFRPSLLERVRNTPSQTDLGREARRRNMHGAFRVRGEASARIWLVDDVVTTAATLEAAALALREAGAEVIVGVTAARTPRSASLKS